MDQEEQAKKQLESLNQALDNPNIPKIYVNGFFIGTTNADITLITQQNGRPVAALNMSFEIAKTLVKKLGSVVQDLEKSIGTEFLTTDDFDEAVRKAAEKKVK